VSFWSELQFAIESIMIGKLYFVYILTNFSNSVLYTGITNNLKNRIYSHKNKTGSTFTSKYNVNKLVYYEMFEDPENAIKKEKYIKNLLRRKKIEIINKFNKTWRDLYPEI